MGLSKYKDRIEYLLSVIDVFSKYLNVVPLKSKTRPSVTSALQSVLKDLKYYKPIRRRPVWVQTDRGKKFLNRHFQDMLMREGIQFHVCRTLTSSAQSWKGLIEHSEINYIGILSIRTLTYSLTYFHTL